MPEEEHEHECEIPAQFQGPAGAFYTCTECGKVWVAQDDGFGFNEWAET